ncbi:MAG TPA: hypothetical protein DCS07_08295 [Bdellovibrionales bacterium]|nr:MAG: hypothetical protein A2X97_09950 [Bdellovibrionales bacterium GWA1_52_35]OFZ38253.1 MAG: hypothetical protein A2070_05110 [Bdellovibrionales bacterium GWC1_52_8]HAR42614.1 hypothetical protein [Bdellovibrionales bacterium]HCM40578.1 hypothetical protein [Bdellovibrionales bacterium]
MKIKSLSIGVLSIAVLLVSGAALRAEASSVQLLGRAYQSNCTYYTAGIGDFRISYLNDQVEPGSSITLVYGFNDEFQARCWVHQGHAEMKQITGGHWLVDLLDQQIDARGSYFLNEIEFVFQIHKPNGEIYYDNGGKAPMGYYLASIPQRTCPKPPQMDYIPVDAR